LHCIKRQPKYFQLMNIKTLWQNNSLIYLPVAAF
jgi:hypothetical protein